MSIFDKRDNIFPSEYPHLIKYADAINEAFWTPEHFQYDKDVFAYKAQLSDMERDIVKKSMLSIGVVENKVKSFWARIDQRMPKTEIASVGYTFASNEVIHQRTYQKLLELLNLESEFENVGDIPVMAGRINYLSKYLDGVNSRSNKEFTKSLILFTLLIENTSLFSQFLIMASFNKHKNVLTNFGSVVLSTAREESIHGQFGAELIKIIRAENPDWFDQDMEEKTIRNVKKAFEAESKLLDWIFEKGELDFLPKVNIVEYIKERFNNSLTQIGYKPLFDVDEKLLEPTEFFDRSVKSTISFDFFVEKSGDYAETNKITDDDWEI